MLLLETYPLPSSSLSARLTINSLKNRTKLEQTRQKKNKGVDLLQKEGSHAITKVLAVDHLWSASKTLRAMGAVMNV